MTLYYDFNGYDFEYSLEECELLDFFIDKMLDESGVDNSFSTRSAICFMIERFDLLNDNDFVESYKDDMKDYFYEVAYNAFKEMRERDADPLGYVGMSQKDFL